MKNLLKLGTALTRAQQKMVNGGVLEFEVIKCTDECSDVGGCGSGQNCLTRTCAGHAGWRYCSQ